MRKHPAANCDACPLQYTGKYVPSTIPEASVANGIAVVGEAPGFHEEAEGKPFVGASGQLLNSTLIHNGIERTQLLVTNAVACRHPNGDNPEFREIDACRPRLISELRQANIRKVLALGNVANESILRQTGVNKLRVGQGRESTILAEPGQLYEDSNRLQVISSLHPAAVLRAPDQINYLVTDVSKLTSSPPSWEPPIFTVAKDEVEALRYLSDLSSRNIQKIAVDIETDIEKDSDFGQPNQMELLCVGIAYAKKKVLVLGYDAVKSKRVMDKLAAFINSVPNVVYQNGKFDQKGLFPLAGFCKMTSDTMFMSYCLNEYTGPMKPHSLEYMGREYLGAPDWKHVLDEYQPKKYGYGVIPKSVLYQYNAYDCDITFDLEEYFRPKLEALNLVGIHDLMIEFSQELMYVEMNGIGIDQEHLKTLGEDFDKQLDKSQIILEMCLPTTNSYQPAAKQKGKNKDERQLNPNSPNQVKAVLADFGAVVSSSDEDTLKYIIKKRPDKPIAEFCERLLEYRGVAKQRNTYVTGIERRLFAGRVYTNFLVTGTTNGRLSSRNPNLQNIPRRKIIRDLFVPIKPENVLVQADYSQAELRILGWLAGDSYFLPIFKEGIRDVFDELTKELFPGRTKESEGAEAWKELRSKRVKPFVYGLAYGRTEYGLAADPELGMTVAEAKPIMQKFLTLIPEIVEWQDWVDREIKSGRDLISPFGRRRRFPLITNDNKDDVRREALSFLPSSTSSDIGLRAMCRVRRDLKGIAWVRNFVHDSILVECHKDRVQEVSAVLEGRMLESAAELTTDVKFAVEIETGSSWGSLL